MLRSLRAAMLCMAALFVCSFASLPARSADLYFSEFTSGKIKKLDTQTLAVSEFTSGLTEPYSLAPLPGGDLLVVNAGKGEVLRVSPTGQKSVFASGFGYPVGVLVGRSGEVYISDFGPNSDRGGIGKGSIWRVVNGQKTLYVSGLTGPTTLTLDDSEQTGSAMFVAHYSGGLSAVSRISTEKAISTVIPYGGLMMAYGIVSSGTDLYTGFYGSGRILRKSGDSDPAVWAQGIALNGIMGLTLHGGELWGVSMRRNSIVRIVPRLGGATATAVEVITKLAQPTGVAIKP